MEQNLNELKERLKDKGLRCTEQRLAILRVLAQRRYPLTAQNIYEQVRGVHPQLRLSTVYRNLNYFVQNKIVRRVNISDKEGMFELWEGEHHHHLICIECGEIIPLDCPLKEYEAYLQKTTSYKIKEHKLKIYGICPACQES